MFMRKKHTNEEDPPQDEMIIDEDAEHQAEPEVEEQQETEQDESRRKLLAVLEKNKSQKTDDNGKKKKVMMIVAVIAVAIAGIYLLAMPPKQKKQPLNLGTINIPKNPQEQQPQATPQPAKDDILVSQQAQLPLSPTDKSGVDTRNGYEKTSQWWSNQIDQMNKMQQVLKERYKAVAAEYSKERKAIPTAYTKELANSYPGSVFNGKDGLLKLSPQYSVYFDGEINITKIVLTENPYTRIYTFKSPTGAKQQDYEIMLGDESVTIDLDPNISNNCRIKSIKIPPLDKKIEDYFTSNKKIPKPEGSAAVTVLNNIYLKQIANAQGKKYDLEIYAEMILSDIKVREYIVNYAETKYTP